MEISGPDFIKLMKTVLENLSAKFTSEDMEKTDLGFWLETLDIEIEKELSKDG